ncbi:MAG: hypothetical protein HY686_06695 [Chloroflexi bacterium]|nr:hypothetical protein [Chloroflexota bacterium]
MHTNSNGGIAHLESRLSALSSEEQSLFRRIFRVSSAVGTLRLPETMLPWVTARFGSPQQVERQQVVRVTNLVTWEGALFNPLRSNRPMSLVAKDDVESRILDTLKDDPFADPLRDTPEDTFGRVERPSGVTAANVAKYDAAHGLVIFGERRPLHFTQESLVDHLEAALEWLRRAHEADPDALYPMIIWNCLWRAGASITHGHLQMTLTRDTHYARVEQARQAAAAYRERYGSNYFDDLFRVHAALGCGFLADGVRVLASLAPLKEREVILLAQDLSASTQKQLYALLDCFRSDLGVRSFNVAIQMRPLGPTQESWDGFPTVVRVVDRGDPRAGASDFGAMELYAQSVVSSDPFHLAEQISHRMLGG